MTTEVFTISSSRVEPIEGYIERVKRIYSCLLKYECAAIRIGPKELDLIGLPYQVYDWEKSICGEVKEVLSIDVPKSLGKFMVTVSY